MVRTAHARTRRLGALLLVPLMVVGSLALVPVAAAQPAVAPDATNQPWIGAPGITETTSTVMARERRLQVDEGPSVGHPSRPLELHQPDRSGLPQDPASPSRPSGTPTTALAGRSAPAVAQTPSTSFTGATLTDTGAFPPDAMGAAGPTQYIVAVNGRLRSFDKALGTADGVLDLSMDSFFASVRNGKRTSDPRIRYDRATGKWYVAIINVALPNRVLLAVSDAGVIAGSTTWTFFYFQQNLVAPTGDETCLADYPTLGIDADALYIGVNQFCGADLASATFASTAGFVVRKSSVQGADPIVVTAFRDLVASSGAEGPYSPQGVDNPAPSSGAGYFIGVSNAVFGRLVLRRVADPGGSPSISDNILITVPATRSPIPVNHLGNTGGTNGRLDGLDDRLMNAVLRNGHLWTIHNIGVDNTGSAAGTVTRNGTRWYDLTGIPSGETPTLGQSGTVFDSTAPNDPDQLNYFMGSIMVSGQGHVATGGTVAGTNHYADAYTAGRLASDPAGTMSSPAAYTASAFAYNPVGDPGDAGGRRWGDYSSTTLDPDDDMTMWTIQEFTAATDVYGVRVVKLLAPPPATPVSISPSSVPYGQPSINVTITGTSASGSGFFDPGAGFAKRLEVVFGGGVTVQSVSYTDPTHVTATISTVGASVGSHAVTVTNPDGQTSTTPSLLGITTPGPATHLGVSGPANATAGSPFDVTVTALDASGAVAADYAGTIHLTASSDGTLPADYTFVPADNGRHILSVTLTAAGARTVTATDTAASSVSGTSSPITVLGGPATHLVVDAPGAVTASSSFNVTTTAKDQYENTATGYAGTVHVTSTDGAAVLPADSALTNGVRTLSVRLNTIGDQTITVTDTVVGSITGTSGTIIVSAATTTTTAAGGGGGGGGGGGAPAPPQDQVSRLGGVDRVATAIAVSQATFVGSTDPLPADTSSLSQPVLRASAVVLSRSDAFADALAGTPLAVARSAPLLLTAAASLDARVLAEIQRVLSPAGTVYLLGGIAALSADVEAEVRSAGYGVTRYAGADRYATAVNIAAQGLPNATAALLATGLNFPDALAGGAAAASTNGVVLLTADGTMPAATRSYLDARPSMTTYALGGPAAVAAPRAVRLAGSDRYDTARIVAEQFFSAPAVAGLASGVSFPDALGGGVKMGYRASPLLLTDPAFIPAPIRSYISSRRSWINAGLVFGGTGAVSTAVADDLAVAISTG